MATGVPLTWRPGRNNVAQCCQENYKVPGSPPLHSAPASPAFPASALFCSCGLLLYLNAFHFYVKKSGEHKAKLEQTHFGLQGRPSRVKWSLSLNGGGAGAAPPRGVQCEKSTVSACSPGKKKVARRRNKWRRSCRDDDDGDEQRTRNVCQVWAPVCCSCGSRSLKGFSSRVSRLSSWLLFLLPLPLPRPSVVFLSLKINLSWHLHLHLPLRRRRMRTWSQVDVVEMPLEQRLKLWN